MIRLDRYLAEAGVGSRSEVKKRILAGRVAVDGAVCRDPAAKIADDAAVTVDGERETREEFHVLALNKPAGYVSATEDSRLPAAAELITGRWSRFGLKPAGRLDRDVTGLLLMTDDGALIHGIISPGRHVAKRYAAELDAPLPADAAGRLAAGVTLDDGTVCLPAELEGAPGATSAVLTVYEGRFHQVKRMFAALGTRVTALRRLSVGPVALGGLPEGAFRELTREERTALYAAAGLTPPGGKY